MLNKKDFLKYASKLAFPIMIQNLIGTLVNVADTVMLGYVSQTAMSASSLANQYTFILFCLYYGMATGTSVLCAQYWGKGDKKTVEKILGLAERISLIVSLVFFVISFSMPTTIMKIFTNSPDTIAAGSEYLKVISFSFMFMGFSQVFMSALRSVGKIMLPSVTYIVSLCVNVFCNATFIFGLFGLPKLGVTGVALGTVIARIAEVLICLIYSLNSSDVRFRIKYFCAKSGILFRDFMKIASPAVINDVVWSFASSAFAAILGHIGDDMVAANAVAVMVVNIGAIACRGFANATTIIISQELGKDHKDTAREYGKRMLRITIIVSLIGCAIILAVRPMILDFYRDKLTETAIYYLGIFIIITIIFSVLVALLIRNSFRRMQNELDIIAAGHQEEGLVEENFREFYNLSSTFNKIINRYKELENTRQEFVSNVSHELKTPITSMKILADSLLMQPDVPVELYEEFMNDIVHEIDRENQIITDLLTLVKMDKTQANLNISSVKINDLLEVLLKRISPIAEKRGIKIRLETMREVIAEVDEVKLSLACNNLIENAVKYNDDNGSVDVSLNADHKFFYIRVKDTGCGIPEDCQEQIFERFYRVDKARSRETGGTGLGLAITRNVILMHKGSIRVHSKEGEGSTFIIRIPLNYIG